MQELSRKGLASHDVDAALRDLFGERMTLELEFAEDTEDRRPAGPDAQFGELWSHTGPSSLQRPLAARICL